MILELILPISMIMGFVTWSMIMVWYIHPSIEAKTLAPVAGTAAAFAQLSVYWINVPATWCHQ